jgi:chromosome segregation ATPase
MNDTAVVTTDLDRLAERVERAATLITELRAKNSQLEQERVSLSKKLEETQSKLQGQDPSALVAEVAALKKEQRDWLNERKDVATRIEAISAKLERLE